MWYIAIFQKGIKFSWYTMLTNGDILKQKNIYFFSLNLPARACTFSFITGAKEGWLDKKIYAPAARKAWLTLITYLNDKAEISEVCEGTNKKNDRRYYFDGRGKSDCGNRIVFTINNGVRPQTEYGDLHGQAPILWCVTALLR
jgi:rhamnogalacturonyl hydrolase YesR